MLAVRWSCQARAAASYAVHGAKFCSAISLNARTFAGEDIDGAETMTTLTMHAGAATKVKAVARTLGIARESYARSAHCSGTYNRS
jgi:hypothetical protein